LLGLIGEIGSVAAEHKKRLRDGQSYFSFQEKFKEELGDVLWYVARLAGDMNIPLEDVALCNITKTTERWAAVKNFLPEESFDKKFPKKEKLPRELIIEFKANSEQKMQVFIKDKPVGSALTDNAHSEDGYRFHDIFHLANLAVIGWSPVMRSLLGKKRKSVPIVDEVEDGARAIIIEEAISAMVFEHAKDHNFFENITQVDYEILKTIKGMVRNFEVKNISSSLWEKAILQGYQVYRELKENNGGKVFIDANKRTIKYLS